MHQENFDNSASIGQSIYYYCNNEDPNTFHSKIFISFSLKFEEEILLSKKKKKKNKGQNIAFDIQFKKLGLIYSLSKKKRVFCPKL